MAKTKILFILLFICSSSLAQENSFWPSQLGLSIKEVKQNIGKELNVANVIERTNYISVDKAIILSREASLLAQGFNGDVYIIEMSFTSYTPELFNELNIFFTKKYGKSIRPIKNEMYNDRLKNNKVIFWDVKKYSIMVSLSTFGLSIQYLDTELYRKRQADWRNYQNEQKNKF